MNLIITRALLIIFCISSGGLIAAKGSTSTGAIFAGAVIGLLVSVFAILLDIRIRKLPLKVILCASCGTIIGLIIANLFTYSFLSFQINKSYTYFLIYLSINGFFGYLGLALGGKKGEELDISQWSRVGRQSSGGKSFKLLDTSVIIDGRIADICDTGFIEDTLVIPQFVLKELMSIADSSDSLKRNRGRRGLDILNKIQKQSNVEVKIVDQDFPRIREVDGKLVALAKQMAAKIITNDYNLNKVAEIQGLAVLNINQLALSVKPLVLPGETMTVYIQREGKEIGQGVAYLDDGTMVVVENGKKHLGRDTEVSVTSVLQTTAGRMIFTAVKEESSRDGY